MTSPVSRRRHNYKREALERVAAGLTGLRDATTPLVDVSAPETGFYVQFVRNADNIVAEAVGTQNLPKLTAHHLGETMKDVLPALGWLQPDRDGSTGGNWSRVWRIDAWREEDIARLVVSTFAEAYGIYPWALVVRTSSDIRTR
jgi:hypothetical protein